MLKKPFFTVLLLICGLSIFGQEKPKLGILPFTGGPSGDGDTITTLISYQREMLDGFTIVPLTNAVRAQVMEADFQFSGSIDSDVIARLGRMLNADYVISGQIRRLSEQNLIILTLINVDTFEMVAGAYREYRRLDDIPAILPDIARNFVFASRGDTSEQPKMTVAPVVIAAEVTSHVEIETLLQILLVEIANTGKYSVLPRMATNQAVMKELDFVLMGRAVNAQCVLSTEVRKQGTANLVTASIFNVDNGIFLPGGYRTYHALEDGISMMVELSRLLTGTAVAPVIPPLPTPPPSPPPPPDLAVEPEPAPPLIEEVTVLIPVTPEQPASAKKPLKVKDPAKFWTIGVSGGTAFTVPWLITSVHGTIAPFKNIFLDIGCDFGLFPMDPGVDYYSLYPFAHIAYFLPFAKKGGMYAGLGAGYLMAHYTFTEGKPDPNLVNILAFDAIVGINLWNFLDISYTFKTNFKGASNKLSVGLSYRF